MIDYILLLFKDNRPGRDYMRAKRSGTLNGRTYMDYKNQYKEHDKGFEEKKEATGLGSDRNKHISERTFKSAYKKFLVSTMPTMAGNPSKEKADAVWDKLNSYKGLFITDEKPSGYDSKVPVLQPIMPGINVYSDKKKNYAAVVSKGFAPYLFESRKKKK